jgi:hypothetical protein
MSGKRVEIAVDPAVRALSTNEHIPDPKSALAEVRRVHALLADPIAHRLARQLVHRAHVVIARGHEQRALAGARRFRPRPNQRFARFVVGPMLAHRPFSRSTSSARDTTPARKSVATSRRRSSVRLFLPNPSKSSERRFSPGTFDKTWFLFKVSAPERRRTEDSGAFFDGADRRNVKSDRGRLIEKR